METRVFTIARDLGVSSDEVIGRLRQFGVPVRRASDRVDDHTARAFIRKQGGSGTPAQEAQRPARGEIVTKRAGSAETEFTAIGDRSFSFTVSTGALDRDGDTIDPLGWELAEYRTNPVVLWCHDGSQPPIARARDVRVANGRLEALIEFPPPGAYPLADTVRGLVREGFVSATSVGFKPLTEPRPNAAGGVDFRRQALVEISLVPLPSNPEAMLHAPAKNAVPSLLGAAMVKRAVNKLGWSPERAAIAEMLGRAEHVGIDTRPIEKWMQSGRAEIVLKSAGDERFQLPFGEFEIARVVSTVVRDEARRLADAEMGSLERAMEATLARFAQPAPSENQHDDERPMLCATRADYLL